MLTQQQYEWVQRLFGVYSEALPHISMERIENPGPDDDDALLMGIMMALLAPDPPMTDLKRAAQHAEIIGDWIMADHKDKVVGYRYGERPANFAQMVRFICQSVGIKYALAQQMGQAMV